MNFGSFVCLLLLLLLVPLLLRFVVMVVVVLVVVKERDMLHIVVVNTERLATDTNKTKIYKSVLVRLFI